MAQRKKAKAAADKSEGREEYQCCPICGAWNLLLGMCREHTETFDHLRTAQIEFLKGVRSLIDSQIESIERKKSSGRKSGFSKIEVEG